jgi:hypothetical protein
VLMLWRLYRDAGQPASYVRLDGDKLEFGLRERHEQRMAGAVLNGNREFRLLR